MSQALQAIREAAIDGRGKNVIWRQVQLENLQQALIDNAGAIQGAIQRDNDYTPSEVTIEYCLTLKCLCENYQSLNVERALEEEYAIAKGQDAESRRDPVGVVYIVPTAHNLFYSVVTAVGAALTAGSCVVIESQSNIGQENLLTLLKTLLVNALDHDAIAFVSSRASDEDLSDNHIRLFQEDMPGEVHAPSSKPLLSSPSSTRAVAIVDRTADLTSAAQAIATARFAYGGNSPFAPDLVLVNEFIASQFHRELTQATMDQLSMRTSIDSKRSSSAQSKQKAADLIASEISEKQATSISSIGRGSLVNIETRQSQLLQSKIGGFNIILHNIRSLDDAIDLSSRNGDLLATYTFADAASGKYVSQFVPSRVAFVNQLPFELLVGPTPPETSHLTHAFHVRYPTELFSTARPQFINKNALSRQIQGIVSSKEKDPLLWKNDLVPKISKDITTTRQKRRAGGQLGFFEQGILLGLGMTSAPILLCVGTLAYYGFGFAWKHLRMN